MPKSRSLQLRTFLTAIGPDVLERYFARSPIADAAQQWFHINPDAFGAWAALPDHQEVAEIVLDDFERIGEIVRDGVAIVIRAFTRFGHPFNEDLSPQELAMLLFLDHPHAFEFARSRYLLYGGGATLSVYRIADADVRVGEDQVQAFKRDVRDWFAKQAKGEQCEVFSFDDRDEQIILVQRGTYVQAFPHWLGGKIEVASLRPAVEDVLTFDPGARELRIKTTLPRDREQYLRLFARHMAADENVADDARKTQVFSLEPLRLGKFNFRGKGMIRRIDLVGVKVELPGVSNALLNIRSDEVRETFRYDLKGVKLGTVSILAARFRFHIQEPGQKSPRRITFMIEPPGRTDIGERRNVALVLRYLEEQGVKLR